MTNKTRSGATGDQHTNRQSQQKQAQAQSKLKDMNLDQLMAATANVNKINVQQ